MTTEIGSPASDSKTVAVEDAGSVELAAPEGWKKKAVPRKGSTPGIKMAVFISPTGEEITNKRQLNQYLRAHPGGPRSSDFDWGTGDTPRRSSRIGAKAKATESPQEEKPPKKERKSNSSTKKKKEDKIEDETANASDEPKKEVKESTENAEDEIKETEKKSEDAEMITEVIEDENTGKKTKDINMLHEEKQGDDKPEDEIKETEKKSKDTETITEAIKDENTGKMIEDINMLPEGKQDDGKPEVENKEKDEGLEEKNKGSCSTAEEVIKDEKTEMKIEGSDTLPEGKQVDKQESERKENENTENEKVEIEKAEVFAPESLPERKENENAEKKETMEMDHQTGEFKPVVQQPQTSVN